MEALKGVFCSVRSETGSWVQVQFISDADTAGVCRVHLQGAGLQEQGLRRHNCSFFGII